VAEGAIKQEQEDTEMAENAGLMIREPEETSNEILVSIGDSLSDIASSGNGENREDEIGEETKQGKWSKDDDPGWVIRTISKTVQQPIDRFWQNQIKLEELTQPRWGDAADYFHHRHQTYCTFECRVPAVVKPHIN